MERTMVVVPEKKKRIESIKSKYNNLQMDDKTAGSIYTLEIVNKVLVGATVAAGIATAVDLVVPDPIIGLDEAGLAALTGLLTYASTLVDNKISKLAASEDADLQMKEATEIAKEMKKCAKALSSTRKKAATK